MTVEIEFKYASKKLVLTEISNAYLKEGLFYCFYDSSDGTIYEYPISDIAGVIKKVPKEEKAEVKS